MNWPIFAMSTPDGDQLKPASSSLHSPDQFSQENGEPNIRFPNLTPLNTLNLPPGGENEHAPSPQQIRSPSHTREEIYRINDDLELMKAERVASKVTRSSSRAVNDLSRSRSKRHRSMSREVCYS